MERRREMVECWASSRGACGRQSDEHVVSAGVFGGGYVTIQGLTWCAEPRRIPTKRAVARVLCKEHNEKLSPVDSGGVRALLAIDRASELARERKKRVEMDWGTEKIAIEGLGLERWLLKTALNMAAIGETAGATKWESGEPMRQPPGRFVQAVFDDVRLLEPMGMYAITPLAGREPLGRKISATSLKRVHDGAFVGLVFILQNIPFLLWLSESSPEGLHLPVKLDATSCQLLYRPIALNWVIDGWKHSHSLEFDWTRGPPCASPPARGVPGLGVGVQSQRDLTVS